MPLLQQVLEYCRYCRKICTAFAKVLHLISSSIMSIILRTQSIVIQYIRTFKSCTKKSDNLDHRSFAFPVNAAFFNSLFVAVNHMIAMRAVKWSPMKTNISAFIYPGRCVYHTGVSKKIAPAIFISRLPLYRTYLL